jgi:hypothetical protein
MSETETPATVTPQRTPESKGGMGVVGWVIFLGIAILLIPLLPFYVLLKLYERVAGNDEPVR